MSQSNEFEVETKAVLYLRVSSKKQMDTAVDIDPDGNSIATQREVSTRKANAIGVRLSASSWNLASPPPQSRSGERSKTC